MMNDDVRLEVTVLKHFVKLRYIPIGLAKIQRSEIRKEWCIYKLLVHTKAESIFDA